MPRKTYTIGEQVFLCKVPDVSELWAMQKQLPLLPDRTGSTFAPDDPEVIARTALANLERCNAVLVRCGINPKIIADSPAVVPPGAVPVNEIDPKVRFELFSALMEDAGFTQKAAEEIHPTQGTVVAS